MKTKLESLIEEAKMQAKEHPSKDARFFANSVHEYLTQRQWVGLTDADLERLKYALYGLSRNVTSNTWLTEFAQGGNDGHSN